MPTPTATAIYGFSSYDPFASIRWKSHHLKVQRPFACEYLRFFTTTAGPLGRNDVISIGHERYVLRRPEAAMHRRLLRASKANAIPIGLVLRAVRQAA